MISPEIIRSYPYFAGLSYDQMVVLANVADEKKVEAGHSFFMEGDVLKYLYLLLEGSVALIIGITDQRVTHKFSDQITGKLSMKDVTVGTVEPREFFGWSALIPPYKVTAGAKAIEASRVIAFDCDELRKAFEKDSSLGFLMTQKVAQIIRQRLQNLHIELLASLDNQASIITRLKALRDGISVGHEGKTIDHILHLKGHQTWSIAPDAAVYDALKLMADKNVGALLVIEDGELVGIFSERDYARQVILKGKSSKETQVREIMSREVVFTNPEQSLGDCMELMTAERIRHLPVLVDGQLVGIVSIGDLVKAIISEQKELINKLETYILENMYIPS